MFEIPEYKFAQRNGIVHNSHEYILGAKMAHTAGFWNWIFQLTTKMYHNRVNGYEFPNWKRPTDQPNEYER